MIYIYTYAYINIHIAQLSTVQINHKCLKKIEILNGTYAQSNKLNMQKSIFTVYINTNWHLTNIHIITYIYGIRS